jgi:hypothetical protein
MYRLLTTLLVSFSLVSLAACGSDSGENVPKPEAPIVTVSPAKILHKGWVSVQGSKFTPKANISSHLKKPDGTEFPILPMYTDEKGELTHEIDTLLLAPGVHELWIVDATGVSSNVARFEVTLE